MGCGSWVVVGVILLSPVGPKDGGIRVKKLLIQKKVGPDYMEDRGKKLSISGLAHGKIQIAHGIIQIARGIARGITQIARGINTENFVHVMQTCEQPQAFHRYFHITIMTIQATLPSPVSVKTLIHM